MNRILTLSLGTLLSAAACAAAPDSAGGAADAAPLTMRFDYAGAEALLDAMERDSLTDADVDALLRVHGVRAMVDNVARFIPSVGAPQFRGDVQTFARTRRGDENDRYFGLARAWREREQIRALVNALRGDEPRILRESLSQLEPYRPATGPMTIGVYLVAGGVSRGFAFENDSHSIYANLLGAGGDYNGVVLNAVHEAYHVLQMAAQQRSGTFMAWITDDAAPPVQRLLMGTLVEGTANFVADPTRSTAPGAEMDAARARYGRNASPAQIAANFALFDRTLQGLRDGSMAWKAASDEGFSGDNPEFYFVGYEMAKALDRYCGARCIGALFQEPPVEFFRRYIALYRRHPEITARFSPATEEHIASLR